MERDLQHPDGEDADYPVSVGDVFMPCGENIMVARVRQADQRLTQAPAFRFTAIQL